MTNGQINFVHDLVQMAKAFEELPKVQAELDQANTAIEDYAKQVQRLELRLIDLRNELDTAHANTHRVEVERDHAERMFLETDDRLNAFRRLLSSFQAEAGALVKAAEPAAGQPEPVATPSAEALHEPALQPQEVNQVPVDPTATISMQEEIASTPPDAASLGVETIGSVSTQPSDIGVSVQPDPTSDLVSSGVSAWSGSESSQPEHSPGQLYQQDTEAAKPADPTASSEAGDGHSLDTAMQVTDALNADGAIIPASEDDVGYHNEPKVGTGEGAWDAWDDWCKRMNDRYGPSRWPARSGLASA